MYLLRFSLFLSYQLNNDKAKGRTQYIRRFGTDYYKCDLYLSIIFPTTDQSINNSLNLSVLLSILLPVCLFLYSLVMIIHTIIYAKYSFLQTHFSVLWILQNLIFSFRKKQFVKHVAILAVNAACTIQMSGRCCWTIIQSHVAFTLNLWNRAVFLTFLVIFEKENI